MFKNTQELKDFILWSRSNGVKAFKIDETGTQIEFTELAFIDLSEANSMPSPTGLKEESTSSKTLVDTLEDANEDEDLFWSTNT